MISYQNNQLKQVKSQPYIDTTAKHIGEFIRTMRENRGITQEEFAKLLNTSQSAVARMENGGQNFTAKILQEISQVLGRKIISLIPSVDFEVVGGKKLHGSIKTNTSKNGAMGLFCAALLNKGKTILHNIPRIEEVNRLLEIFQSIGVQSKWLGKNTIELVMPAKFSLDNLDADSASKIRSGLMIIGALTHFQSEFRLPHSGGCKMGERTISAHRFALEKMGIKIKTEKDNYRVTAKRIHPAEIVLYEQSDTAAENVLLAAALTPGKTILKFAPANYQVQEVANFLQQCGVKIEGIGTHIMTIEGVKEINQNIEYYNSEDPIDTMMLLSAAIVTNSELEITRCPIDFLELELLKLEKMGLKYERSEVYLAQNSWTKLVDLKIFPSKLVASHDKIHAQPYPGINIDNLPFFVPIATQAEGQTLIHDWTWENRAIYFTELNRLGADITLADPHRAFVQGPTKLKAAQVVCPPALRPAVIILIAMLAAEGKSILRNVYSIMRGYEEVAERLNSIGADIKVLS